MNDGTRKTLYLGNLSFFGKFGYVYDGIPQVTIESPETITIKSVYNNMGEEMLLCNLQKAYNQSLTAS